MSRWQLSAARLILVAILFFGTFVAAENVTVESDPRVVGPDLHLTISLHGNPLRDVKLNFYTAHDELKFVLMSNAHGKVKPPSLLTGVYRIEARFEDDVVSNVYVKVVKGAKEDKFTLDLTPKFDARQAWLEAAQKLPIAASVKEFKGTILDPGNGPIPNAEIRVVRRGMEFANKVVLLLKSDAEGHFSSQLEPGEYIGFFSEAGFKTRIVPFVVTKQGEAALRVVLDIGSITENMMISANGIQ